MAFCGYLKQSTTATLILGPFVDEDDGKTAEAGLTISQADVRLSKNGANMAQKTESTSCTHDELGNYACPIDATDTNTLGLLDVMVHEAGALPIKQTYQVVTANWYDSMCAADQLDVNVTNVAGTGQTANDNGADINAILVDTAVIGALGAGLTGIPWNAAWDTEVQSEVADALTAYDPPTNAEMEARTLVSASYATAAALAVVDAITDKLNTAMELDGAVYRFTTNALELAPSGAAGEGALEFVYTLTSTVDALPIDGASIWATTTNDPDDNVVASGTTNAFGVVTFYLDAGTYYIWRQKTGWTFTNPDTEVVS